jgi:hypothetical protein
VTQADLSCIGPKTYLGCGRQHLGLDWNNARRLFNCEPGMDAVLSARQNHFGLERWRLAGTLRN